MLIFDDYYVLDESEKDETADPQIELAISDIFYKMTNTKRKFFGLQAIELKDGFDFNYYIELFDNLPIYNIEYEFDSVFEGAVEEKEYKVDYENLNKYLSYIQSRKQQENQIDDTYYMRNDRKDFVIRFGVLKEYKGEDEVVTIPDNVSIIGKDAFAYNQTIKEVIIPERVRKIEEGAFACCVNLSSVIVRGAIKEIGNLAFYKCFSLKELSFKSGLNKIGFGAFANCYTLKSVEIPDTISNIDFWAFADCFSLQEIILPCSMNTDDYNTPNFYNNCSLETIIFKDGITRVNVGCFNCKKLKYIHLPSTLLEFKGYETLDTDNVSFFAKENTLAEKLIKLENFKYTAI